MSGKRARERRKAALIYVDHDKDPAEVWCVKLRRLQGVGVVELAAASPHGAETGAGVGGGGPGPGEEVH